MIKILILEDAEADAKLIERALRTGGVDFSSWRVDTREDFVRALDERLPDVILADFNLPGFDGLEALTLARERLPRVPVIIVTGALMDEAAVELLREGATDYILKDRLSRLVPAVRRALDDAEQSRRRDAIKLALKNSELRYRRLFETAKDGVLILDGNSGRIFDVNPFLTDLLGYTREEMVGKSTAEIGAIGDVESARKAFSELQRVDFVRYDYLPLRSKAGNLIDVEVISNAYAVDGQRTIQCNIRDIRERVKARRLVDEQLAELRQFQRVTVDRELRLQELEAELARVKGKGG
jgi:PAS domain S-box-containing protein